MQSRVADLDKVSNQFMLLLFCKLSTNNCSHDYTNSSLNDIKTVYKIINYKTNYLYSFGDYTVIN